MGDEHFIIEGREPLVGTVSISGSKNAALPCMAAVLLTADDCVLENVPEIDDINIMAEVVRSLGAIVEWEGEGRLRLNCAKIHTLSAPRELVVKNRASFLIMGSLLGRFGEASSCPPGGDIIGQRPIDVHLTGFASLGAEVTRQDDRYWARGSPLKGAQIFMDYPSNMGTENLMLAACLARGRTVIKNVALEPEICALASMLNQMGARVYGAGTSTIEIHGVDELKGTTFQIIPDRIEAGTFAMAAAITGGDVLVENVRVDHLDAIMWKLRETGAEIIPKEDCIGVKGGKDLSAVHVQALPYPGFATDLQAVMGVLLTQAKGVSVVHERVYDNRLLYVSELRKMGAEIVVAGQTAIISGPTPLVGSTVRALDIRSGAALVLAGLAARGVTEVFDIYHLDRGYESFEEKLQGLGAHIRRAER